MAKNVAGMNNVVNITTGEIPKIMTVFRKKKKVMGVLGGPGIGKTAGIKYQSQMNAIIYGKLDDSPERKHPGEPYTWVECPTADDWDDADNWCYSVVLTSQIEEIDSRGLPHILVKKNGEKITVYTMTELFPQHGRGDIVLDEFPNGRTQVQTAMQPMILEHKAGNIKISPNITFVIAGNRPGDNCGTYNIPSALKNRVGWFEASRMPVENWLELLDEIGKPLNPRMAAWMLSIGSKYYDNFDPKAEQFAYGTPRSIEAASELIEGESDYPLIAKLVGSEIGESAGVEFVEFLKLTETVDINKLLKEPKSIHEYENNLGLLYSISITLIDKFVDNASTNEPILDILMETKRKEHGMFVLKGILNKLGRARYLDRLTKCKNSKGIITKYYQLLKADTLEGAQ